MDRLVCWLTDEWRDFIARTSKEGGNVAFDNMTANDGDTAASSPLFPDIDQLY